MNSELTHNYSVDIKDQFLMSFIRLTIEERILLKHILLKSECPYLKTSEQRYIFEDNYYSDVRDVLDGKKLPQPIDSVVQKIFGKTIKLEDANSTIRSYWLTSFSLNREGDTNVILFTLSDITLYFLKNIETKELSKMIEQFTTQPLCNIKHYYTASLYRLLEPYFTPIELITLDFDYEQLRQLLGVEEGTYSCTQNFKKRVLNPAISEIHKVLGIPVFYKNITEDGSKAIKGYRLMVKPSKLQTSN